MSSERLFIDAVDDSKVTHGIEEYLKKSSDTEYEQKQVFLPSPLRLFQNHHRELQRLHGGS